MKDNEIAGTGNHNTAEYWEYDTRLGRRWNIDPVVKEWESGYATFGNTPIWHNDVLGDHDDKANANNPNKNNSEGLRIAHPNSGKIAEARSLNEHVVRAPRRTAEERAEAAEAASELAEEIAAERNWAYINGKESVYDATHEVDKSQDNQVMTGREKAQWFLNQFAIAGIASAPQLAPVKATEIKQLAEDATPIQIVRMGIGNTRASLKEWLKGLSSISRSQAMRDVENAGFKEVFRDGERINYKRGNYNIRFDPPDNQTNYYHMQIERGTGRGKISYDENLNRVRSKKGAAHIKTQGP